MDRWKAGLWLATAVLLAACSQSGPPTPGEIQACQEMEKRLVTAEDEFTEHARVLREQRMLLVDYDRKMIAELTSYHDKIRTILDEDIPASNGCHCTGKPLADLKHDTNAKLNSLRGFLSDFRKALRSDAPGVYIQ